MNKRIKQIIIICFSLLVKFNLTAQTITRGPYLQKGTTGSIVVKWRTSSDTESIIKYGTSLGNLNDTAQDLTSKSDHEIEITGLNTATKYYYSIHNSAGVLVPEDSTLFFKTHPTIGTSGSYRFWVLGDCGTADANASAVRDAYDGYPGATTPDGIYTDTDGILFLGDNAYLDGTDAEFQAAVFDMYPDILKNTISWSCFGNHEGWWKSTSGYPEDFSLSPYFDIYTFPISGESGGMSSGTEAYYSFDYGNIHFIVLDSFGTDRSVGAAMYNWAEYDIQNTTQQWIVAFWHHPPYSKGTRDSDNGGNNTSGSDVELIQMRENFLPMLEANGVDLVLAGHSHSYERSYLINGHYGLSGTFNSAYHIVGPNGSGDGNAIPYSKTLIGEDAGKGAVYVVTGSAGKKSNLDPDAPHDAMYYTDNELGSSIIEVDNNNLTLKFLRETGAVEDQFTITKTDYDYVHVDNGWSPSAPPSSGSHDIVVRAGNPTISSNSSWNSVTVSAGAGLTIGSGTTLTTTNGIDLNSASRKYSNLISDGTISGVVNYNRYTNKIGSGTSGGNDLVSAPLSGQTFGAFHSDNPNLAASNDLRAFAPFNNSSGVYDNYDVNANSSILLEAGKGYRAATDDGSPLKFAGSVNIGNVNTTISIGTASKWNLVGNPYPSYLNAQAFLSANGGVIDETVLDPNYNAIYGYNDGTDGGSIWSIINSVQNVGKNIAPGQGFFVASNGTGGSNNLNFTPAMRTSTGTDDFIIGRHSQESSISHLKLKIRNSSASFNTDFYFTDRSTSALDPGYDAGSFDALDADLSIYSHLVSENSGVAMGVQALSNSDMNNVVVPIGIHAVQGDQLKVSVDENDLPSTISVYLEDNVANTLTLLNTTEYIFTPTEELSGTGRFFLHYTTGTLTLNEKSSNGLQVYSSVNPNLLHIKGKLTDSSELNLYDIQGRLVLSKNLDVNNNSNTIDIVSLSSGVYIVKLKTGSIIKSQKVIIR